MDYVVEAPFGTGHQNIGQGLSQHDISIFYSENPYITKGEIILLTGDGS